jgi:decaprenylphospho-beta-D-erythro-pentofuranosid-2-ulose 2-reductase
MAAPASWNTSARFSSGIKMAHRSDEEASSRPPDVLIIGATSRLAQALAAAYAGRGATIQLAGRDSAELGRIASDLTIRHGVSVTRRSFDAHSSETIDALANELLEREALPNDIVVVMGYADNLSRSNEDVELAGRMLAANYGAIIHFLTRLLPRLDVDCGHRIVLISSVAGDRGRRTNFVYGAAKAALATYAQGLRARLRGNDNQVLTVKLGYMDTRLAFGKTPGFMTPAPEAVARSVLAALDRNAMVVYVPWFWRPIMGLLRCLPEALFIRLPLP